MFYEELGAAVVGWLYFVLGAVVFLATGSYLVRGRLVDTRTLADTGISMLAVLSLSYPYLIQSQLAELDFDIGALLLVSYFVVLLDIAVANKKNLRHWISPSRNAAIRRRMPHYARFEKRTNLRLNIT